MRPTGNLLRRSLHYECITEGRTLESPQQLDGKSVVLFLHGLLGSGKNLRLPAKKLTQRHDHLGALLVDLRGHGMSSQLALPPPNTLDAAARDIIDTLTSASIAPHWVVGHSLGGRVALEYLRILSRTNSAEPRIGSAVGVPRATWLLDCVPGQAHPSVANVVDAVSSITPPISSKKELTTYLTTEKNLDPMVAAWMATNLVRNKEDTGYDFAFDLHVAKSYLQEFPRQVFAQALHEINQNLKHRNIDVIEVNLVRAGQNHAWTKDKLDEVSQIQRTMKGSSVSFQQYVLAQAGHWVHVDSLVELLELWDQYFDKESASM